MENDSALKEFVQSMASLVDSRLNKLRLDYTVEAEIMSVENADEGEYKVLYQSNIFSAFAGDENKKYKVGDMVYMLVPQNNFNMKKIIIGKVSKNSFNKANMNLSNFIVANGPSINSFYYDAEGKDPINEQNWGLVVGKNGSGTYQELKIINNESYDPSEHESFIRSAINNEHIEIQASFLTSFQKQMTKGNYGLKVTFYVKNPEYNDNPVPENVVTQDFIFDIDSFNGAPYDFRVWSPQVLRFSTQKDYLLGLKSIYFFEEGFEQDEYRKGTEIEKQTTNPNLFVKDIKLQFIDSVNLVDNLFYLNIVMPNGNNLGKKDVILNGILYSGGEDVLNPTSAKCYWYERDGSVVVDGEGYDPLAGPGWKKVTETENVVTVDFNQLILYQGGSSWVSKEFKLVIKYKDENIITKTVTVYNSDSPYNLKLIQITDANGHVCLQVEGLDDSSDATYSYSWYKRLPDGQYSSINNQTESRLDINDDLRYSFVDFSVEIKKDNKYYCSLYKTVSNVAGEEDVIVTYIGTDMYQYDANGDITIDNAELERTLEANITWADGKGSSSIIRWLDCQGHDIVKQEDAQMPSGFSQPQNCMMKDMWVDTENKLHYKIKPKFNRADGDNFIVLKIITVDNQVFDFKKEISFFKDGDQGTNGTTFACVIRLFNQNDQRAEEGFYPLIQNDNGYYFYKNVYPKVLVYKDGEVISSGDRFKIEYLWSGINVSDFGNKINTDNLKDKDLTITNIDQQTHILRIKVTITDKSSDDISTQVYYNYPLSIWIDGTVEDINEVSIPSLIMYSPSGTNPSFVNNPVYVKINDVIFTPDDNVFNQYGCLKENNSTNAWRKIDDEYYLNPPAYYIGENPTVGTGIVFDNNNYRFNYSILCYLNTYGNEAINGWDGTAIEINNEGGYILAPQIGAGVKDSDNRFTGVVMGKDTTDDFNKFGLYGYDKGVQTFGLKDDGSAFFGPANGSGQININGSSATIYGGKGNSFGPYSMILRLTDPTKDYSTKAIEISGKTALKPVFYVTYGGDVYLKGKVEADAGYIGSWHLKDDNTLESDSGEIILDGNTGSIKFGEWIFTNRGFYNSHHMGTGGGNLFVTTETIGASQIGISGEPTGENYWSINWQGKAQFKTINGTNANDLATESWVEDYVDGKIAEAYNEGYDDGYEVGYAIGYEDGKRDSSSSSDDSSSDDSSSDEG